MPKRPKSPPPPLDSPTVSKQKLEILNLLQRLGLEEKEEKVETRDDVPETTDQAINLLVARLQKTQEALDQADQIIEQERAERKSLQREIRDKNREIEEILERENRNIGKEVEKEIKATVAQAVHAKQRAVLEKEELKKQIETMNEQKEELRGHLQDQDAKLFGASFQYQPIIFASALVEAEIHIGEVHLKKLESEGTQIQKQKEYIVKEAEQIEGAIRKANEVRLILSRVQTPYHVQKIYAKAEGKEDEKAEQAAKKMEQNNKDYFYDGGNDDEFWGANDNSQIEPDLSFVKQELAKAPVKNKYSSVPKRTQVPAKRVKRSQRGSFVGQRHSLILPDAPKPPGPQFRKI